MPEDVNVSDWPASVGDDLNIDFSKTNCLDDFLPKAPNNNISRFRDIADILESVPYVEQGKESDMCDDYANKWMSLSNSKKDNMSGLAFAFGDCLYQHASKRVELLQQENTCLQPEPEVDALIGCILQACFRRDFSVVPKPKFEFAFTTSSLSASYVCIPDWVVLKSGTVFTAGSEAKHHAASKGQLIGEGLAMCSYNLAQMVVRPIPIINQRGARLGGGVMYIPADYLVQLSLFRKSAEKPLLDMITPRKEDEMGFSLFTQEGRANAMECMSRIQYLASLDSPSACSLLAHKAQLKQPKKADVQHVLS